MAIIYLGGLPASGPLRGTAGQEVFLNYFRYLSATGRPVGGDGVHHNEIRRMKH